MPKFFSSIQDVSSEIWASALDLDLVENDQLLSALAKENSKPTSRSLIIKFGVVSTF